MILLDFAKRIFQAWEKPFFVDRYEFDDPPFLQSWKNCSAWSRRRDLLNDNQNELSEENHV